MEEVISASAASDDDMNKLIDEYKRTKNIPKEAKDNIANEFMVMSEDQDNLDAKNGKCDSDESEILNINAGGGGHICDQEHPYTDKV